MEQDRLGVDLDTGLHILRQAIDTHAITSHFAFPLMIRKPGGLVIEVTDGTTEYNSENYRVSFFYDLSKTAVLRMAFALSHELESHGATAVALTPGWLRSEAMLEAYSVNEANLARRRQRSSRISRFPKRPRTSDAPSRRSRPTPTSRAGTANRPPAASSRRIYGFTDLDGSQPDAWRYLVEVQDQNKPADTTGYR